MKKTIGWIVLVTILCVTLLTCVGCGAKDDGRKKIVVTIFPVYDWVMNVLGDNASDYSVTLLLDSGADLHSYQPTVADIVAVAQADLFLYVGGESDGWVKDAMKNKKNKSMRTMDLLDLLGDRAKEEEIVEGMAHEEEEEEEGEVEYDEHVWLSLRNAAYYVRLIKDQIAAIDPDNAEIYEANAAAYVAKLNDLDARYVAARSAARCDTLVFGDRFPFRYLVDDYDLKYYAAYLGCAAELTGFDGYAQLAEKVNTLDLKVILKIENSSDDLAKGVRSQTGTKDQKILVLDSLQSATKKEYKAGRTYLSVMEDNLNVLKQALA